MGSREDLLETSCGRRHDGQAAAATRHGCASLLVVARAMCEWLKSSMAPAHLPALLCVRYTTTATCLHTLEYEAGGAAMASSICKALAAEMPTQLGRTATVHVPRNVTAETIGRLLAGETRVSSGLDMDVEYTGDSSRRVRRYRAVGTELQTQALKNGVREGSRDQVGCPNTVLATSSALIVSGGLGALGAAVVGMLLQDEASAGCSILVIGRRSAEEAASRLDELGWSGRVA